MKKTITIVVEGPDEVELEEAFQEAVCSIKRENREGQGKTAVSSYHFEVKYED